MRCVLVSHTHWDREWYRTFESFRARLVDTVDRVLELVEADPGFRFQLDGQSIVVEDYLEIRPERREALETAVRAGRIAIGPWYVQPDSLIPGGETHVRNLLEGRRIARAHGGCSTVAYTPDSFGHPDQLPQILRGFGLGPFVYWRGNADEIDHLPADYRWRGADGSEVIACHLARGYFAAWGLADDVDAAAMRLAKLGRDLAERSRRGCVLLMNGLDHMLPDANTREVAEALAEHTGWEVVRGLLDDYVEGLPVEGLPVEGLSIEGLSPPVDEAPGPALPVFAGELLGGRVANLLPGVWSTHVDLKLANRRCETALVGRAEPFAAIARLLGGVDERASLRLAWRTLLPNQAHDSICGCSQDRVHEQMTTRLDTVLELADETTARLLDRLGGLPTDRQPVPAADDAGVEVAVWNPSPHPRTDVVRIPLAGFPAFTRHGVSPLLGLNLGDAPGVDVDGRPARLVVDTGTRRPMMTPSQPVHDVEVVVADVPPMGWRRLRLTRAAPVPDRVDAGRTVAAGDVHVAADERGLLDVSFGDVTWRGLGGLQDHGDRGDTYDFDPVADGTVALRSVEITRRRHPSGIEELDVLRILDVPRALAPDRATRADETVALPVRIVARVAPGVARVDCRIVVENTARDHRLRVLFPTGTPTRHFVAETTFGRTRRSTAPRDGSAWIHPAPRTFPLQGHVEIAGLGVAAPGLCEAEVDPAGTLALTLVRSVGWLSRPDLRTRPGEAGPSLRTPGAWCPGPIEASVSLYAAPCVHSARDAECGLIAAGVGADPLIAPETPVLRIAPDAVVASALKPAEHGDGVVLRLLNPTDEPIEAVVEPGPALAAAMGEVRAVRLDETADDFVIEREGSLPGREGSPPGREGSPPGRQSSPPGREGSPPGREGSLPGREGSLPGREGSLPGREGSPIEREGSRLRVALPPRALRSLHFDGVSRAGGAVR